MLNIERKDVLSDTEEQYHIEASFVFHTVRKYKLKLYTF